MKENMTSYAKRTGIKEFSEVPFQLIDGLLLCQLSYYKFNKELFQGYEFKHTVREGLEKDTEELLSGILLMKGNAELVDVIKKRGRHGNLKAANYVETFDMEEEKQFSAITYQLEKDTYYIAFRGTDSSVVGWKEDFNLSYQEEIPAQKDAVSYAIEMMTRFPGKYYLGGHSKGGNLALYTAMRLPKEKKADLIAVHDFDGPGFAKEVYQSEEYRDIRDRLFKIVPETAIVGLLWEEDDNYKVVKSSTEGILQHNPFSWNVKDQEFVYLEEVDEFARVFKRSFDLWLESHSEEERERVVETVFDIIYSAGIVSFREMTDLKKEKLEAFFQSLQKADSEEKRFVISSIRKFFEISTEEVKQMNSAKIREKFSLLGKAESSGITEEE